MSPVAVGGVQGVADGGVEVRPAVDPAAVDGRHDRAHVPLAGAVVVLPQPRATGGTRTEVAADLGAVVPPAAAEVPVANARLLLGPLAMASSRGFSSNGAFA